MKRAPATSPTSHCAPALDAPAAEALEHLAPGWDGGNAPNELTGYICALNHVRRASRALCHGSYRNVVITNEQLLFERDACAGAAGAAERVLVAVNADDAPFTFGDGALRGRFEVLLVSAPLSIRRMPIPTRPAAPRSKRHGRQLPSTKTAHGMIPCPLAEDTLALEGTLEIPPYGVIYLRAIG